MRKHGKTDAARDKKNRRPLLHMRRRHRLTKSYPQKVQATEARPLLEQEAEIRAEVSSKESARTRHVIVGTVPCVLITSMKQHAHMEQSADFDMLRRRRSPARSRRKVVGQGSVALVKDSTQLGCVFRDSHPRKSILWKVEQLGSKHTVKISKGTWHTMKIRERKGPSLGVIQKCESHERNPCAPRFEERTQDDTLHKERCAR